MTFSRSFPKTTDKSVYPKWEEVFLSEDEEKLVEQKAKEENIRLMEESLSEARAIIDKKQLKQFQTDLVNIAIALFEKKASHSVFWKESLAKEKFDEMDGGK